MTKEEKIINYIESNKYLRKGFQNLNQSDIDFFIAVSDGKLNGHSVECEIRFKQVLRRMTTGFTLRECRGLLKAFKTLQKISSE